MGTGHFKKEKALTAIYCKGLISLEPARGFEPWTY